MKKDDTQADVCGNCGHAKAMHDQGKFNPNESYCSFDRDVCKCEAFTPPAPQADREKAI